ncbi:unnamed protein product [Amoebophrya sp. A25]|nr:unnamed protein product [Amoebophrya sp. A25]|eukprot:GSA25T00017141001.1
MESSSSSASAPPSVRAQQPLRRNTVMPQQEKKRVVYPIDSVAFLGAGMNIGQPLKGLEIAPEAIRAANVKQLVRKLGYGWHDYGDLDFDKLIKDIEQKRSPRLSPTSNAELNSVHNQAHDDLCGLLQGEITKKNFDRWRSEAGTKLSFGEWLRRMKENTLESGSAEPLSGEADLKNSTSSSSNTTSNISSARKDFVVVSSAASDGSGSAVGDHEKTTLENEDRSTQQPLQFAKEEYFKKYPVDNLHLVGPACKLLHDRVLDIQRAMPGQFMLTVGGDHSVACPTITAMQKVYPDLCILWIDAHGDCNTPKSSPSGHYHGMPAAHVMGWFEHHPPGFETWMPSKSTTATASTKTSKSSFLTGAAGTSSSTFPNGEVEVVTSRSYTKDESARTTAPVISPNNFAFIGLRDIDPTESELMRNSDLHFFTMRDVDEMGIAKVVQHALERIDPNRRRPIHLSFDIDGCDPSIAPGTGTCARGGLSYREAHYICEELALTRRLVSMDLVEVNPVIDTVAEPGLHGDDPDMGVVPRTVRLGTELVLSALGLSTMHRC